LRRAELGHHHPTAGAYLLRYAQEASWREDKAEIAKAEVTYEDLAKRMKKHGFQETKASVTNKLARGTFPATFFLGVLAALELPSVQLEDV